MILAVKVHPNRRERRIIKISEREYEVYLKEPAEKDRANVELVKALSKYFSVDLRKIKIKNARSRNKIVEVKL